MGSRKFRRMKKLATASLAFGIISSQSLGGIVQAQTSASPTVNLRIMETTDLHTNLVDYDYYKDAAAASVGLAKTATLIKEARKENPNTFLVDNGDLIQGTPLGTYMAQINQLKDSGAVHPVYKAMNLLDYDAATFGNHEFNYGLDFLDKSIKGAKFPYINANVYIDDKDNNPDNDVNKFTPYLIMDKTFKDENGNDQKIKIGVIGLVTPQIMEWDKVNLTGKVVAKDIVATAKKFVPEMRAKGADIVIAMAHSGFDGTAAANDQLAENAVLPLSKVPGIDAITFSHSHKVFPTPDVKKLDALFKDANGNPVAGVDNAKGTINGVAAVQSGYGGSNLGLIDLKLVQEGGKWKVSNSQSSTRYIYDSTAKKALVDTDPAIVQAVAAEHEGTKKYANQPIGETTAPIHSYFALVQDDPSVQIVTNAQKEYVSKYISTTLPQYKDLPILSVGAPFKAGRNGPSEYTDIAKGPIAIKSASDLYLYDNTLKAVKVKGSGVKEWLEMSAGMFNQIDPAKTDEQQLLNSSFQVFNFDVIDGVTYQVDVTKPAKYKVDGAVNDASSSRIVNLQFNGKPIDPNQEFIVVTNNYRASGGGNFPGLKNAELIVDSADENREALMDYISEQKTINPAADKNWSIAPVAGNVKVTFTSSPSAVTYLPENPHIKSTGATTDKGFSVYSIDLSGKGQPQPDNKNVKVQLLGINDFHGQLDTTTETAAGKVGSAPYLATYLKERKKTNPNTLLVHAGDSVGATAPVSSMERDKPTLEFMNMLKFDVGTLGNHEFDQGVGAMLAQINGGTDTKNKDVTFDKLNFPYVNANVVDEKTGENILPSYVIKEVGGQKVGFIGVATNSTPSKVSPDGLKGVKFVEQAPVVNKAVQELKAKGVKAIVVLAHDPASVKDNVASGEAVDLANAIDDEVDVIFAGDNHAKVNTVVDNKLIVQAYSYGTAFADVDLEIDPATGDIVKKTAEIVDVKQEGVTPDADTVALINKYLDKYPVLKQPVGTTDSVISRNNAYNEEAPLGNLIADAMRDGMNTDFAFMNPGGIRADLPKGDIKFSDLAKIQPFGNTLVKMTLTGSQIKTLLQQQWGKKSDGSADTKTLQISGLKYTADFSKPAAERIVKLTKADGTPIEDAAEYTVTVNNFMAAGGDNYKVLVEGKNSQAGLIDLDVFYNYITKTFKGGKITAALDGRIVNLKSFSDVPQTHWAYKVIQELSGKQIIDGVADNRFEPEQDVTRAQFVNMIVKQMKLVSSKPSAFKDVPSGSWYAEAVAAASEKGIVEGSSADTFAPDQKITREEMAVMITRMYAQLQGTTGTPKAVFTDGGEISAWAKTAVETAAEKGLMTGRADGVFAPRAKATRAEAAQVIYNGITK
ncbi:bifunctional 2',3'-cyclic-nucleotide 2'-phosphodiesterase/3'-nucleotidase [Paenibacillus sp. UNC499MF]|uniref:bifunctional 2',3'-cyclic-nucleotide 2'-phosphodiesterase/3'-nucleotidase n=1 Tax=Paenibacillus sp. UNC499MF TaxID=1502751 RepID=UPI0008A08A5C|nr:2',3'-cyclic-nucleotide 2'-phosphodiesterase / 3'-nucleotidase / 5'-nucleotidase [Paenibacillus sp. UNC499MF]